jgi:hypothetical protein
MMEHTHPESAAAAHKRGGFDRWRVALMVGDILSFLVFASIGRSSHGAAAGLSAMFEVLKTAAPFLLGWFLVAPFLGAYRRSQPAKAGATRLVDWLRRSLLARTLLAWLIAWPLALALRALFLGREIPLSFALVTFLANTILLLGWRGVFVWLTRGRELS